jgi:hypothetical protein
MMVTATARHDYAELDWQDDYRWELDQDPSIAEWEVVAPGEDLGPADPVDDFDDANPSEDDRQWAAENLNDQGEPDWDTMANVSLAIDRHERGVCCC